MAALARNAPGLRSLALNGCSKITDAALLAVAAHAALLEHLDVGSCTSLRDVGLRAVMARCPRLSGAILPCCEAGDGAFEAAAADGPRGAWGKPAHPAAAAASAAALDPGAVGARLTALDLSMTNAGDAALLALFAGHQQQTPVEPPIRELRLAGCPVSSAAVPALSRLTSLAALDLSGKSTCL